MNAQVALALDSTGALAPTFPGPRAPDVRSFDLKADPVHDAIWVERSASASGSVTIEQLLETKRIDNYLMLGSSSLPTFKLLTSTQPRVFSVGGDLQFFSDCIEHRNRTALTQYAQLAIDAVWANLSAYGSRRIKSIALVQGEAQGGGFEAALSCNTLIAERGCSFGFPESLFGMFPGMGGEILLASRVGHDIARRMVTNANRFSAEFLHEIGVVDYLAEPGTGRRMASDLMSRALAHGGDEVAGRMDRRQQVLDGIRFDALGTSIASWVDRALALDARHQRTMKYIVEMQTRRVA